MFSLLLFFVWLTLLVLFSRILDWFLSELFPKARYRWIIWPGILIHELSHGIMGKLMGANITDVSLFSKKGGSVTHTKPKIPIIGIPFTAMAPLFGCTLTLLGLLYLFDFENKFLFFELKEWTLTAFFSEFIKVGRGMAQIFISEFRNWMLWVFLYFTLALTTAIAPSNQDFKNAWLGIIIIFCMIAAFLYFEIWMTFIERVLGALISFFAFGFTFEFLIVVLLFPFWIWKRQHYRFSKS